MYEKLVFSHVNQFSVLCAFYLSFLQKDCGSFSSTKSSDMITRYSVGHYLYIYIYIYIITFLKNMAGINYLDNKPVENVKLGSFKGQS